MTGNAESKNVLRGKLNGLKTIHGYSAYEVAVINGFRGTEEEWLESLNGNDADVTSENIVSALGYAPAPWPAVDSKVQLPSDANGKNDYGTDGQVAVSDGEGGVKWAYHDYYTTAREELGTDPSNLNTAYIYGLYDALMGAYPDRVQKNEVHNDDGTFTNYEYVISTGEYNTVGKRGTLDADIKKPKYLIMTGIHGREKTAIISAYRFICDVLEGNNIPTHFKEGSVIHILPMGTPYAVDANTRENESGVDINRNFDWMWVEENSGTDRYSGTTAASEKETQAIVNWLKANSDAELFVDVHNSGNVNEVTMIAGMKDYRAVEKAKTVAMRGIDRVIPFWRDVIGYNEVDMSKTEGVVDMQPIIFSYTSTVECGGLCIHYATGVVGIPSLALELSALQNGNYLDYNGVHTFTPETISAGAEGIGNVLLEFYEQAICFGDSNADYGTEGQFAVSDGKGGIAWLSLTNVGEVGA